MSCAELRSAPSSEYLLFEDQPASAIPYTPIEETAKMNSTPTFRSASCIQVVYPNTCTSEPNGITETDSSAMVTARNGASRKKNLLTCGGSRSSLVMSLMTSASGCSNPCGPTRDGPRRDWICAITFRSTHCK